MKIQNGSHQELSFNVITVCNETTTSVRNIGAYLDQGLTRIVLFHAIIQSAYFHIRKLYSVSKSLSKDSFESLVQ